MDESKWIFTVLLSVACAGSGIVYFKLDPYEAVWFCLRVIFQVAVLILSIQFIWNKLDCKFRKWKIGPEVIPEETEKSKEYDLKKHRDDVQAEHTKKAESYKERILNPREDAKKKKKEEEYYRFLGHAWKGKGNLLGGEDERVEGEADIGSEASNIRRLPASVKLHIPKPEEPVKQKRVIQLPDEPGPDNPEATLVVLRTPIGTSHRRRFLQSHTLQVVLDFMSTCGFSQSTYTLALSFPRQPLTDHADTPLSDLDFGRQVVLNVEEKDL